MSNSYAIAAVTATLRQMIDDGFNKDPDFNNNLPDSLKFGGKIDVTTNTLDQAHDENKGKDRINVCLYLVAFNAAWRNRDLPGQVKSGETGQPPLALNLYYLITAYGEDNNKYGSELLLGRAMQVLHENPLLKQSVIKAVLGESELQNQIESVRITPLPMSLDDISKLWMTLQTQYRISAAYQVEVVLIESRSPVKAALPVLTLRPADKDKGILSQADLIPPFSELTDLVLIQEVNKIWVDLTRKYSAEFGDTLSLRGHHLNDATVKEVLFSNPHLVKPISLKPDPKDVTDSEIKVVIPDGPNEPITWVAGIYNVKVVISRDGKPDQTTNELPIALAPQIGINPPNEANPLPTKLPVEVTLNSSGDTFMTLDCSPQVLPEQRAVLLLGDMEIPAETHPDKTLQLKFNLKSANPGVYLARLRVAGMDSITINDFLAVPLEFDPRRTVTIKQ